MSYRTRFRIIFALIAGYAMYFMPDSNIAVATLYAVVYFLAAGILYDFLLFIVRHLQRPTKQAWSNIRRNIPPLIQRIKNICVRTE